MQHIGVRPLRTMRAALLNAASAEDAREKGELQRAYYALLHGATVNDLTGALLSAPAATRDAVLEGLKRGAAGHVDAVVRKTCMQVTV